MSELAVSRSPKLSSTIVEGNVPSASDLAAAAAEGEGLVEPGKESEAKAKKRKAEASAAGKTKKVGALRWSGSISIANQRRPFPPICSSGATDMPNSTA